MLQIRVIPCLLLKGQGLVKTVKFKDPKYIGDPINAIKIFNDKEVDELVFLDITATREKRTPNLKLISEIASECFMPLSYGGGVRSISDIREILRQGVEKVIINTYAVENPEFIKEAAEVFGSSTIVVCIDYKKNFWGKYEVCTNSGTKSTKFEPVKFAKTMEEMGAGELIINSIDKDGTMKGYDIDLLKKITQSVNIPVVSCGGAGNIQHLTEAIKDGGASAVAAGSMFVFHGPHRAVLISYPSVKELEKAFI